MYEKLFVVAETVQFVQDGKVLGLVGIEGSGENDAIRDSASEDFAPKAVAFDPAGSKRRGDEKDVEEGKEAKERAKKRSGE
jgi:hypothetical protein